MRKPSIDSHPPEAGAGCAAPGTSEESPLSSRKRPLAGSLLGVGPASRRILCSDCCQVFSFIGKGRISHRCDLCRHAKALSHVRAKCGCRWHRTCRDCGVQFESTARRGPAPTRCLACKSQAKRSRIVHVKDCPHCGKIFHTRHAPQHYCSPVCAHTASRQRCEVACKSCGRSVEVFASDAKTRKYCSPRCRAEGRKIWRVCVGCGKDFNRKLRGSHSYQDTGKYCTRECYLDHRWGKDRPRKKWSVATVGRASRRALATSLKKRCDHYGVHFDPACTRRAVCERDGWKCQDCGVRCHEGGHRFNKKTRKMSLRNAEHDHITPLSVPGSPGNTFANSQCLCRRCNGRKGKKRRGQLLIAAFAGP